jgi:hypothetical protein
MQLKKTIITMFSMRFTLKLKPFASAFVTRSNNVRFIRALQAEDFSSNSWMDKNQEFTRYESTPNFKVKDNNGNDKQRRRRQSKRKEEFNQMKDTEYQNFRDNFRGTRVFVQGLPDYVGWKELKDHFKQVGEVVFASVSMDPNTGRSKCCGIVQFESTDVATKAIQVMRDIPLDGNVLYVREDYQENKDNKELGRGRSATPPTTWRCADDTNLSLLSEEEQMLVKNLIKARDSARRRKSYESSDKIRDELKSKYSVHLDDRLKMFWVATDNAVPNTISEIKGEGRWGDAKPWRQIPTTPENDACVNPDLVNALLKQRDIARKEKDFGTADSLLEEARTSPDGNLELRIHDESRTWRIWTAEPPPKEIYERTATYANYEKPNRKALSPAEECIAIVTKHDPSKLNDIKTLLSKFPGREYNILKKLKENYE